MIPFSSRALIRRRTVASEIFRSRAISTFGRRAFSRSFPRIRTSTSALGRRGGASPFQRSTSWRWSRAVPIMATPPGGRGGTVSSADPSKTAASMLRTRPAYLSSRSPRGGSHLGGAAGGADRLPGPEDRETRDAAVRPDLHGEHGDEHPGGDEDDGEPPGRRDDPLEADCDEEHPRDLHDDDEALDPRGGFCWSAFPLFRPAEAPPA